MKYIQVTIGAAATQVSTSGLQCRWVSIQNNATHAMRVGDSTASVGGAKGILLASGSPGGSVTIGAFESYALDLSTVYIAGTQGDTVDVWYVD